MFANYFMSALRNFLSHKLFTTINILSLTIGLSSVMLIILFVRYELSFDNFWDDAERIYRVHWTAQLPGADPNSTVWSSGLLADALKKDFPQIAEATRIYKWHPVVSVGEETFIEDVDLVDQDMVKVFSFDVIAGDIENALNSNNNIILTKTRAKKYFADKNAIGEVLTIDFSTFERDYIVTAVIEDLPTNSQVDINAMVAIDEKDWSERKGMFDEWYIPSVETYFKTKPGIDISLLENQIPNFIDRIFPTYELAPQSKKSDILDISFMNIRDLHMKTSAYGDVRPLGDGFITTIFSVIASFILIIASINFINLSTARAERRAKEVALRKVMGAQRLQLIIQFLLETVLYVTFAVLISLAIVEVALPVFNEMINRQLVINYNLADCVILLVFSAVTGLLAGIYPAFVLSYFRPVEILKSSKSSNLSTSTNMRVSLVFIQFSISAILFISAATIYAQVAFSIKKDLGYTPEKLMVVEGLGARSMRAKVPLFINEIKKANEISDVTMSSFTAGETQEHSSPLKIKENFIEQSINLAESYVSYDFFKTYNIPLLAGREYDENFNDKQPTVDEIRRGISQAPLILNKAAALKIGFKNAQEAIGKTLYGPVSSLPEHSGLEYEYKIIGITPDVHFYSLKREIPATMFFLDPYHGTYMTLRYKGDAQTVISKLETIWEKIDPDKKLRYKHISNMISDEYSSEQGQFTMLTAFSILAIFVACLGLFGLASFTAEKRTKEIGIRKVMGAETWQIVKLLVWQFSKPVLYANLFAWPIAFYAMSQWLQNFVYRIDNIIVMALCLLVGLVALLIAWITVAGNSFSVACTNPIKALRYE